MDPSTRQRAIEIIDDFQQRSDLSDRAISLGSCKDPSIVRRLRNGEGVSLTSIERIEDFISNHVDQGAPTPVNEADAA